MKNDIIDKYDISSALSTFYSFLQDLDEDIGVKSIDVCFLKNNKDSDINCKVYLISKDIKVYLFNFDFYTLDNDSHCNFLSFLHRSFLFTNINISFLYGSDLKLRPIQSIKSYYQDRLK